MGKPQHVEDDLMMTIASDDELSVVEESSDDETEQDAALKDAIISKKQEKAEERAAKKQNQIAEDFKFDETDGYRGSAGSSWDFTNAISRIVHMEERGVVTKRTTVQTKIDNFKKEKLKAKEEKKAKKLAAEKKKEKALKKEQATEKEDEDMSGDSENDDDGKDDNDNDAEDESSSSEEEEEEEIQHYEQEDDGDEDQVAEEEARLMAALKDGKNGKADKDQEIDELERAKAAEFFESDPFAAEEFAKTSFATFADLKLSRPLMRAITELGFEKPTPIQQRAIPIAMTGKDICASAQTGSGKTAAFLLPILERLQFRSRRVAATRVMIICPVRELATQCQSMLEQLARFTDITSALAVGGLPLKPQEVELRNRPDVVICTPGRMIDHLRNSKSVHMDELEILVLDEADRLLELGFTEEVQELVRMCPVARQTMLFSATLSTKVDKLIELSMKRPVRISTDPLFDMAKHLVQEFVRIRPQRESDREAILLALCTRTFKTNTIVFMETKVHAHRMMIIFGLAGLKAAELHGNLTQKERLEALQNFRDSNVDILLCTDVAARGIDVKGVHAVINYEMPKDITTYVHRVGRTARAGRNGRAVTLTSERRRLLMKEVSRHCHGFVKSRAVPDPVIAQWKARIESMESDIKLIMREEVLEKRMREVERDADRASNMLKYEDEIRSRPARTWFQSEKEKKNVMERAEDDRQSKLTAAEEAANGGGETKTRAQMLKSMNHKKRRRFEIREREQQMLDDARRAEEEAGGEEGAATKKGAKKVFGSVHVAASAKHSKKEKALEARAREEESISEIHERKRLKREKDRALKSSHKEPSSSGGKSGRGAGGGFDVDLSARDYKPIYETTKRRDAKKSGADTESFDFKEKITNFKKHAKKGTSKFKSQSKFRRR